MAEFNEALKVLQPAEGGLSTDKDDPGGVTNWGISQRFLDTIIYVNPFGRQITNVTDLTKQDAAIIFDKHFWEPYPFADIQNQAVANVIFVALVNMSPKKCFKMVQKALNVIKKDTVSVDGVFGNKTIAALNAVNSDWFINAFKNLLREFYLSLNNLNKLKGWLNRVNSS